jgi:type III pantothenate kinase
LILLLVDIGNTRVKWARLVDGRMGKLRAAANGDWTVEDYAREVIGRGWVSAASGRTGVVAGRRSVARVVAPAVRDSVERAVARGMRGSTRPGRSDTPEANRIVVSSVAGSEVDQMLIDAARQVGAPMPELVVSQRSAGGVTTAYLEPWRLGVDRFVGAIGAHHLAADKPVCVVNVGTALTIDLVDDSGRHRGGAIVPGPALMVDSLLKYTSGIRRRAQGGASGANSLFAQTTRTAIGQGAVYATAAVIDRAIEEAQKELGQVPLVVMTGGGSAAITPLVRTPCVSVPDLVLHGLAVWASHTPLKRRRVN